MPEPKFPSHDELIASHEKEVEGAKLASELRAEGLIENFEKPIEANPERREAILKDLDEVAKIMDESDAKWWLAGGLALDVRPEVITRDHQDIDIAVMREDAANFFEYAKSIGYKPYTSERTPIQDVETFLKTRKDVFFHKEDSRKPGPLAYEVMFLPKTVDGKIPFRTGSKFLIDPAQYENADTFTTQSGRKIRLTPRPIQIMHKLYSGRQNDYNDIQRVLPTLTQEEHAQLDELFDGLKPTFYVRGEKASSLDSLFALVQEHLEEEKKEKVEREVQKSVEFVQNRLEPDLEKIFNFAQHSKNKEEFLAQIRVEMGDVVFKEYEKHFGVLADYVFSGVKVTHMMFREKAYEAFALKDRIRKDFRMNVSRMSRWTVDDEVGA